MHGVLAGEGVSAVYHHRIHCLQARYGFSQWPGGEQVAIAKTACPVDDRDLDIALQTVMLQAVIAQHDIALRISLQGSMRRSGAIPADPYRANVATCHQERFIANLLWRAVCQNLLWPLRFAAIATTDDERMPAAPDKLLCQCKRQRGFAGSADTDVSDHEDRQQQLIAGKNVAVIHRTAQCGQRTKNQAGREKNQVQRGDAVPVIL